MSAFNQNIFVFNHFLFPSGFIFHAKKIMRSMKLFHSIIFGSEIWSFIY